ncbi:MAG: hypothetical protein Q7R76_00515 [Candidatus Woesearchaeota archaeon]|nr:hypothetical protein [Candidatus Woesearchaeota archaeon]
MNNLIILLILTFIVGGCASSAENIQQSCCAQCLDTFSQSPVGVGQSAARCGEFTSSLNLSNDCAAYFKTNSMTVAQCQEPR